jgi:glycosyltransferase involved in cell wall biosynthesis
MEYERLYGKAYAFAKVVYPELRLEVREGHSEPVPGAKPPFLLTVGAIGDRKNQLAVIEAFEKAGLPERGYSYVICGGPEPGFEKVHSRAQGLPWVLLTGYVSDSQLRWLYANATGFLLPSLLEGFGIPAAEAIVRDLVPLVGRGGALHEVTGNSAVLVDPSDVDSIAAGINEILSLSAQQKAAKLANLRERLKFFAPSDAWKNAILATPANNLVSSHAPFEILA